MNEEINELKKVTEQSKEAIKKQEYKQKDTQTTWTQKIENGTKGTKKRNKQGRLPLKICTCACAVHSPSDLLEDVNDAAARAAFVLRSIGTPLRHRLRITVIKDKLFNRVHSKTSFAEFHPTNLTLTACPFLGGKCFGGRRGRGKKKKKGGICFLRMFAKEATSIKSHANGYLGGTWLPNGKRLKGTGIFLSEIIKTLSGSLM